MSYNKQFITREVVQHCWTFLLVCLYFDSPTAPQNTARLVKMSSLITQLPVVITSLYYLFYIKYFCVKGWGGTQITLLQTPLPIVSNQTCQAGIAEFQPVDNFSMVCAGLGENKTIIGCKEDSGGPLICEESRYYHS